ncbi:MAG: helix-turn-helix domain-containing protein [Flavobacteriales bacterium]
MEKLLEQSIWIQQSDLYERDPQLSENGKSIVLNAVRMIADGGLDGFTLKKLAQECGITEPTIYRYFSNKISLCAYICSIHWTWRQWQVVVATNNIKSGKKKLVKIAELFLEDVPESRILRGMKCVDLTTIAQREWTRLLHPIHYSPATTKSYDELLARVCAMVKDVNPNYVFAGEFARTFLELCFSLYPSSQRSRQGDVKHSVKFIKHLIEQL